MSSVRSRSLSTVLGLGAVLVGMIAGPPARAYTIEDDFYRLVEDYVSPHIPWAKPYSGGKVRALFIVPRGTAREVIEVAERLEMTYEVVMTLSDAELGWTSESSHYALAEGISYDDMVRECKEKLKGDYDVIVTGHIKWDMFPPEILYELMKKVHDGTGLVHSYQDFGRNDWVNRLFAKAEVPGDFVAMGVPWQALPVWREMGIDEVLELREFHDGRIALLKHGSKPRFLFLTPKPDDTDLSYRELHYEYYQSLAIRAILWAARKEPEVRFESVGVGGDAVARADLAATELVAELTGPTDGLKADMSLRDEDKRLFAQETTGVQGGKVSFELPTVPGGRYFADVVLRSARGTVNWASVAFEVTAEPGIQSVVLDKISAKPGDLVTAAVKMTGEAPAEARLDLKVVDNLGRLIGHKVHPLQQGDTEAAISFRVSNPLALSAEVRVNLEVGGETVARGMEYLYVPLRRSRGNFAHAVWSAIPNGNEFVRRLMYRQLHACDVDMHTNSPVTPELQAWAARNNFDTIPYATRYHYSGKELVRKPCLTDPEFLQQELTKLEENARALAPYGPRAYTLGDECFLGRGQVDICFSDTCTADLREWLKTEYESVAELNESWETDYKSFDEAEPITLADARELDQPARWVDHRRHMEFVYARMMAQARAAIRAGDPGAEVGFDGPFDTSSFSGNDWWRLMEVFDICNLYERPEEWEAVRSFAKPGMLLGIWYGGYFQYRNEDRERLMPWRGLLNGFNSMWWYAVYHGLSTCPMDAVTPSMTIYPAFQWATEEVKDIRAGIGKALLEAERLHDGIATHYSQSSVHAATWSPEFGRLDVQWRALYRLLEDMGLQYNCLAYAQIQEKGIDPQAYPVFVMPCSQAVSPGEAEAIRRYVQDGGMVIADVRPALLDHHGKPFSPGLLDDLFGIMRAPGKGRLSDVAGVVDKQFEGFNVKCQLEGLDVDGDVEVTDGTALGSAEGAPIVILKRTGEGLTALLNYGFTAADRQRLEPAALDHWAVLCGLMALNGVKPPCPVVTDEGPMRGLETVRYQDGPVRYYGFLKHRVDENEPIQSATITTPERLHTYDARAGEYLGRTQEWEAQFVPSRAKVFAQVPYTINGLSAHATKGAHEAGEGEVGYVIACTLRLATGAAKPGRHWVNVKVVSPDGKERKHYMRNVALTEGTGVTYIPMALDDPTGTWTILAREVISGKVGETTFQMGD